MSTTEVTYGKLVELINSYFFERPLRKPDTKDAAMFLATEVGEFMDALLRQETGWVRNNPSKNSLPESELADCLMMIVVCSECLGINVFQKLKIKLEDRLQKLKELNRLEKLTQEGMQKATRMNDFG